MNDYQPSREDKFSFGLWTVGWQAQDVFGGPTRAPLDSVEAVHRLSDRIFKLDPANVNEVEWEEKKEKK